MKGTRGHWSSPLPFYYGWLLIGVAFVTMAIGVTGRNPQASRVSEAGWLTDRWHRTAVTNDIDGSGRLCSRLAGSSKRCLPAADMF